MCPPASPQIMNAADAALAALGHLDLDEQLAATEWATLAVLGALRDRFEQTPSSARLLTSCVARRSRGSGARSRRSGS